MAKVPGAVPQSTARWPFLPHRNPARWPARKGGHGGLQSYSVADLGTQNLFPRSTSRSLIQGRAPRWTHPQYAPFLERVKKTLVGSARRWRRRRRSRLLSLSTRPEVPGPARPEATRPVREDEAGPRSEHRPHSRSHPWPHSRPAAMHLSATAMVPVATAPAMMPAPRVGTQHETAEEDDSDDEHDTGHDPDPRGDRGESVSALVYVRRRGRRPHWGRGGRRRGGDGTRGGLRGRGWFGHVHDDRRRSQVRLMNCL